MTDQESGSASRREGIVKASSGEFLRYGYKKTSMDDLARAAGLSRQGLYLHFATKEALFKQAVLLLVATTRAAVRAALDRNDLEIEERLLAAFAAAHARPLGQGSAEQVNEMMADAELLVGPVTEELEDGLIADVAKELRVSGVAARWKDAGLSAKDLAEQLYSASVGAKQRTTTEAQYRDRMRIAVRLVCRGRVR